MHKMLLATITGALTILMTGPAAAVKIPIPVFWSTGEKLAKVTDFPDLPQFRTPDGKHVDPGVKYRVFEIFSVPLWDWDRAWIGHIGSDERYVSVDHSKLLELAKSAGVSLPDSPTPPFWDAWGGKLIVGIILSMLVLFGIARSRANA